MSCNCKADNGSNESKIQSGINPIHSVLMYGVKTIGFFLSLLLIPIINVVLIKMMFQAIVLNKNVDIKKVLEYYFKGKKKLEDFEDDEDLTDENEYEMLNVEEIIKQE